MQTMAKKHKRVKTKDDKFIEEPVTDEEMAIEQSGCDITFQEEVHLHLECKAAFKQNKRKSCKCTMGFCNAVMRNRIENILDSKDCVRNDPIVALDKINEKMHDPQMNECKCKTSHDIF